MKSAILILFVLLSSTAYARVFSFKDAGVAAFIDGSGGMSNVGRDAYHDTSGSGTSFDKKADYNFSGELGFAFQITDKVVLRTGVEGVQAQNMSVTGLKASTGAPYMDVQSKVAAFNPNITMEFAYSNSGTSRLFMFGGVGYSTVKVSNDYTVQALAVTDYSMTAGTTGYKEAWVATTISYDLGTGWEFFIIDNVTMSFMAGWRFMYVPKLIYDSNVTVIRKNTTTAVTKGSTVTDNNGKKVDMDLGGPFAGIIFKFYIPPLN